MNPETQPTQQTDATPPPETDAAENPNIIEGVDLTEHPIFRPEEDEAPAEEAPADSPPGPAPEPKPEEKPTEAKQPDLVARLAKLEAKNRELAAKLEEKGKAPAEDLTEETALRILAAKGISLEKLAERVARGETVPKPKTPEEIEREQLKQQVAELRERDRQREQERQAAEARATLDNFRLSVRKAIVEAEDLPFLSAYEDDAVEDIFATIQQHAARTAQETGTPEILDVADVAKRFEARYRERFEKAQAALTRKGKAGTMSVSPDQQTAGSRPPASGPRTLTNRAAASATPARAKPLTDEEMEAEAAAALKFL